MKKFIVKGFGFLSFLLFGIVVLVLFTAIIGNQNIDLTISEEKNILILGNSHIECAVNDKIFKKAYNFSRSGSAYFYEYVKLKEILRQNKQIDTLMLSYGYFDLHKDRDFWFSSGEVISTKIKNHFILFKSQDYASLLKSNYTDVLLNTPKTIFYNVYTSFLGKKYLGGHKSLDRNKLEEAKKILQEKEKPNAQLENSKYQSEYLLKIYEHCQKNNIKLILLNAPIHSLQNTHLIELKPKYYEYAKKNLPDALLVDHANYPLPDSHYSDLNHLNYKGAEDYSNFLQEGYHLTAK